MKRGFNLVFGLVLTMFLLSFVNSAVTSCSFGLKENIPDNKEVFRLSANTNAHGELLSQNNYDFVLGCNSAEVKTCSTTEGTCKGIEGCNDATNKGDCDIYLGEVCSWIPANKIIGLSSETNAHAESPSQYNYDVDVCYGDLRCASSSGDCPLIYPIEILSLSSFTNAHIGSFADYPIKVCCKEGGQIIPFCKDGTCNGNEICGDTDDSPECHTDCDSCPVPSVYWTDYQGQEIEYLEAKLDITKIYLILEYSPISESSSVVFNIYEKDFIDGDDIIKTNVPADFVESGRAYFEWTITQQDIDLAKQGIFGTQNEPGEDYEFAFNADTDEMGLITSDELIVTISEPNPLECSGIGYCSNYEDLDSCETDSCNVASTSVQANQPEGTIITCDGVNTFCYCKWDLTQLECNPYVGYVDGGIEIGSCYYDEDSTDDCEGDGLLSYSWTGIWNWGNNLFTLEEIGGAEGLYVEDLPDSGDYHYDPNKKYETCSDGENTMICPAQIQLPFFTAYSLIIAIVLIVFIYFLILKNSKKKGKKISGKKVGKRKK